MFQEINIIAPEKPNRSILLVLHLLEGMAMRLGFSSLFYSIILPDTYLDKQISLKMEG